MGEGEGNKTREERRRKEITAFPHQPEPSKYGTFIEE
jgi:hypothetical protein